MSDLLMCFLIPKYVKISQISFLLMISNLIMKLLAYSVLFQFFENYWDSIYDPKFGFYWSYTRIPFYGFWLVIL